jgi:outer membrane protein assembly factor BamD
LAQTSFRFRPVWRGAALALLAATAWRAVAPARADLVWTPDAGWQVQGGVLQPFFGGAGEAASALEAMNRAKTAQEGGHYWTALDLYDQVVSRYPSSVFAPEALYQQGLIYTTRHQFDKAFAAYDRILTRYPDYPHFNEVIGRQFHIADLIRQGERPYAYGIFPWFKDVTKANTYYNDVVKSAPYSEYAPMALMNVGLVAEHQTKEPDVAIDALDRLINDYPESMLAPNGYLELAGIYSNLVIGPAYDQGSTREAIRYLRDYIYLYPTSSDVPTAESKLNNMMDVYARSQLILGDFYYYYRNNNRAALVFYNQAITLASDSPGADQARAQIKKIQQGVAPPMTPYDVLFGRYQEPSVSAFAEQGRIENLASAAFAAPGTEDFSETPGTESVETIGNNGQAPMSGIAPATGAPLPTESGFLTPLPPASAPASSGQTSEGRPLIR